MSGNYRSNKWLQEISLLKQLASIPKSEVIIAVTVTFPFPTKIYLLPDFLVHYILCFKDFFFKYIDTNTKELQALFTM